MKLMLKIADQRLTRVNEEMTSKAVCRLRLLFLSPQSVEAMLDNELKF